MFLSRNKKNNVYPCESQFYYIKVGFTESKLYRRVFVMKKKNAPKGNKNNFDRAVVFLETVSDQGLRFRCQNHWLVYNVSMESKGIGETLRMRRMM